MWLRTWLFALLLAVFALASTELLWRSEGHRPSVVDDPELWSQQRARIYGGTRTVVLIGMSRMQFDFVSEVFRDRFPTHRLVRLAAPTRHVTSALEDLANDEAFQGTVLASVAVPWLRSGLYPGFSTELAFYESRYNAASNLNRSVASFVQARLATVNPLVNLRDVVVSRISTSEWPKPTYYWTNPDRSRYGDYSLHSDLEGWRTRLAHLTATRHKKARPNPAEATRELRELDPLVEAIQSRGGQVVFLRLPTSGLIWAADEEFYPKRRYWDRFAAQTNAKTLHFRDIATLEAFTCPDGSHLDMRDAARFTNLLLDELVATGILAEGSVSATVRVSDDR